MKIVEINTCDYGSTGKIMLQIADYVKDEGGLSYTFSRKWKNSHSLRQNHSFFGFFAENILHRILGQVTGFSECFSYFGTRELIKELRKINPDVIHLHNLHGMFINLPLLFKFIKKNDISVIWTLHDCWAFTGHCPHFDMVGCDKWKSGCKNCSQYKDYPKSCFDNSKFMYRLKKSWFTGVKNLTIVTPSEWLAGLVKQSFLGSYSVKVINNGIDLSIFKPTASDFREKYNCENKYILLGVAFDWNERKGIDVFIELSKRLDNKFQIVLVGTDEKVDRSLPKSIISIHRTQNQTELAEIYTAADLFINPTREEVLGLVNIEALACGTPVVTFNTGGSPECIDGTCGAVVEKDDIDALVKEIERIYKEKPFGYEACLQKARNFDKVFRYDEYIKLYC